MIIQQRPNGQYDLVAKDWLSANFNDERDQYRSQTHAQKSVAKGTKTKSVPDYSITIGSPSGEPKIRF